MKRVFVPLIGLAAALGFAQAPLEVTFVHTNDLHSHVEPTKIRDADYGGYARHKTLFDQIRKVDKNPVFLNAGDVFQGTLYFNVYEGLADGALLNMLGYDAIALGNHEFDKGPETLIRFAQRVNFPLICANIDMTANPELAKWVKKSVVLEVGGQKIGVVGAITEDTPNISSPGDTLKFLEPKEPVQAEVDRLIAEGINKIVLVTHVGYGEERRLTTQVKGVDILFGGHSHTPLGTPDLPGWRASEGPYPTITTGADGKPVYVLQAWEWGKVVGKFKVQFDAKGDIEKVIEAKAIVVDKTIASDPAVEAMVDALKMPLEAVSKEVVGEITEPVEERSLVGQFLSDAYLSATKQMGAVASFMNPGGVRAGLDAGPITWGEANSITPFRNTVVVVEITGAQILELLKQGPGLIPSEGTSFKMANGSAANVIIAGSPLEPAKTYKLAVNSFMAGGGDSLFVLKDLPKVDPGMLDIDVLVTWLKANRPLKKPVSRRGG